MPFCVLGATFPANGRRCDRCDGTAPTLRLVRLGTLEWAYCWECWHWIRDAYGLKEEAL